MATTTAQLTGRAAYQWGGLTLFAATAVILAALGFEYIGGYEPCALCLEQRYAYYAGIPLLFGALALYSAGLERLAALVFFLVAAAFLFNAGLGVYHAGVEWKFWEGPATCTGGLKPLTSTGGSLLKDLATKSIPLCGEAQGRFLGLSFAGWNVIASVGLTFGALKAAFASVEPH
jgi:disulfide bond formation protein DsbB